MTNTTLPDEILKTDAMGRVRTPAARRKARGEYPLAAKKPVARARVPEALRLVEAVIAREGIAEATGGDRALGLQLPGGARLEIHDARQAALAAELLRALARSC